MCAEVAPCLGCRLRCPVGVQPNRASDEAAKERQSRVFPGISWRHRRGVYGLNLTRQPLACFVVRILRRPHFEWWWSSHKQNWIEKVSDFTHVATWKYSVEEQFTSFHGGRKYESEHFNFCPSLNCQHLNVAICCERIGIVVEKKSPIRCGMSDYLNSWFVES